MKLDEEYRNAFLRRFTLDARPAVSSRVTRMIARNPEKEAINPEFLSEIRKEVLSMFHQAVDDEIARDLSGQTHEIEILCTFNKIWKKQRQLFHNFVCYHYLRHQHKNGKIELEASSAYYQRVLSSRRWRELREEVFRMQDFICSKCLKNQCEELHHKHYDTLGFETHADVTGLCLSCHTAFHKD